MKTGESPIRNRKGLAFGHAAVHAARMNFGTDAKRRWMGVMFLAIAAGLLIWGQTVFKPWLKGLAFIAYHAIVFLFTMLAIFTALLDIWIIRRRTRRERRELIQRTLGKLPVDQPPAKRPEGDSQE
jgi:signal transduction histidine kinase